MSDSGFAAKIGRPPAGLGAIESRADIEPWDDLGCFGWLRGQKERSPMLELRKKSGAILAVGYGWLERIGFDPSDGITLHIAGQQIVINGRNLNAEIRPGVRLFEGLTRHRVPWLRETGEAERFCAGETGAVIDSIEW